jgi:dipeptidyl aminopeptidase/acylaminoacyl peptidase
MLRPLLLFSAAAVAVPCCVVAGHAYLTERRAFRPHRHAPAKSLRDFDMRGGVLASFPSRSGERLHGYYAPPRRGGAVVLAHGCCGERSDLFSDARILAAAGFGVLVFDFPGHGESEGAVSWDEGAREALRGALDWLAEQPGVDGGRLGAFGFSMGGYTVAQVAASDARLRAVALAGTPHDAAEHTRWEYRRGGRLRQLPALLAARASGLRFDELVPERVVGRVAPRSLLVITGSEDRDVPPWMAERLYRAASEPKRLLVVEGASHGGYFDASGEPYARELRDFFGMLDT